MELVILVVCLSCMLTNEAGALPKVWGVSGNGPSYPGTQGPPEPDYPEPSKYQEPEYPEPTKYQEPEYPEPNKYQEPEYPEPSKYQAAAPKSEYSDADYQEAPKYDLKCETYYDYEFAEKCVDYYDKVCYTKYEEYCDDVTKDKCQGVVKTEQVRQCTNVTDLLCGLVETVKYEMATASYTVQKCHKVKERVCDTVFEPRTKTMDDYHCINIKAYKCYNKEKTLYDQTCRHVTKYNCDDYSAGQYNDAGYPYGKSGDYGKSGGGYEDEYAEPECKNSVETNCYETPRVVPTLECSDSIEKVCEKFPENVPYAGEKQACHDEEKRVCELEEKKQPKQIKKYVYKKQCKKVPRQICSSADVKTLKPSCTPTTYKNCYYKPREQCEQTPKTYCYKVPKKIAKQRCHKKYETTKYEENDYAEPSSYVKYPDNGYKPEPNYE